MLKDRLGSITDQSPPRSKDRFGTFRLPRAGLRLPQWRLVGWLACLPLACSGRATWLRPHSRSKGFIASLSLHPLCLGVAPSESQVFRFSGFLPSGKFPTRTRRPDARRCESWSYFPGLGAGMGRANCRRVGHWRRLRGLYQFVEASFQCANLLVMGSDAHTRNASASGFQRAPDALLGG